MADEANLGEENSPTCRAVVGRCRDGGAGGSGRTCSSLLLALEGPALFRCVGSFGDEVAPAGSVGSECDSVLMLKSFKETFRLSLKRFR